jgi:prevent-host-death family protein
MNDEPLETISVSVFKATCLGVLKKVHDTGRPILVTRRGAPVVQIGPPPPPAPSAHWLGSMQGRGKILGDIVTPLEQSWEAMED